MIIPGLRTPPADTEKAVTDDYVKAANLNYRIKAAAQVAQQSLYEMCKGFKEMRDSKLYKISIHALVKRATYAQLH